MKALFAIFLMSLIQPAVAQDAPSLPRLFCAAAYPYSGFSVILKRHNTNRDRITAKWADATGRHRARVSVFSQNYGPNLSCTRHIVQLPNGTNVFVDQSGGAIWAAAVKVSTSASMPLVCQPF